VFCPGFRPSATSNSVASAACSQMLGTSARSAAVKFSSTYAAGSLRPAGGRCRCAPAESRRCPGMTPPISNHAGIQTHSRRHQFAKCSGHDVNTTAEPTDELTGSYQAARDDKLGFTVTRVARQSSVGRPDEILGNSPRQAPRGPRKVHQTAPRHRCSSWHQCNPGTRHTAVDGVSEEPALPLTFVCQIGHRSRVGRPCSRTETACWVRPSSRPAALRLPVFAIANNTSSADNSSMRRSAACA
jgi:hypothetical protein